jgi:hypothetical protein
MLRQIPAIIIEAEPKQVSSRRTKTQQSITATPKQSILVCKETIEGSIVKIDEMDRLKGS